MTGSKWIMWHMHCAIEIFVRILWDDLKEGKEGGDSSDNKLLGMHWRLCFAKLWNLLKFWLALVLLSLLVSIKLSVGLNSSEHVQFHQNVTLKIFCRCCDELNHREFKNACGASLVKFNLDAGGLVVLVSLSFIYWVSLTIARSHEWITLVTELPV